tara:strand:+ start:1833 stop:3038 length:1206 start_codon:yes stop_codon:yes gene_type:complete
MAKAKFNLRTKKTEKETPVYMKFYYKAKLPFTFATEIKTYVKKWDFKKQRIIGYSSEVKLYNKHLDFLALTINSVFLELRQSNKAFTLKTIETVFQDRMGMSNSSYSVLEYTKKMHDNNLRIGEGTKMASLMHQLKKYGPNLNFEEITHQFYFDFTAHLLNQNLKRSYVNNLFTMLKIVCNNAVKNNLTQNLDFKNFKRMKEKSENIHIPIQRIGELYRFKNLSEPEAKAVDVFILGSCLGLRFSDWHKIKPENIREINGNKIISITDQKKGNYLAVPLNIFPYAIPILEKYNYQMPKLKRPDIIELVRTVAERLGWIEPFQKTVYSKNVSVETFRFCDMIGTHTARRSFVTNLKTRYSDSEIMKMTGHKSTSAFTRYDRQTAEANAVEIANKFNKLKIAK